jgi:hypothetical protein
LGGSRKQDFGVRKERIIKRLAKDINLERWDLAARFLGRIGELIVLNDKKQLKVQKLIRDSGWYYRI